jgi:hypothetical protein
MRMRCAPAPLSFLQSLTGLRCVTALRTTAL